MSVEFNEGQYTSTQKRPLSEKGIIGLIIKTGLAKDVQQANYVMIGIIVVMAIIFYITAFGGSGSSDIEYDPLLDDPSLEVGP